MKNVFRAILILYCAFALYLLFINLRVNTGLTLAEHLRYRCNFIPFETISNYFNRLISGTMNNSTVVKNLAGNILLLFPVGLLLPCISKKCRSLLRITLICVISITAIELLQLLLRVGSFDVDDFILNIPGGMLGYAVYKIPFVSKLTNKIIKD